MSPPLDQLLSEIRRCRLCVPHLPLGPRPIVRASRRARLLIAGQAPGTRVHASGIPWQDRSGERLRQWLDLSPAQFYDERGIAIVPMGFCYPGRDARGGDLPPRPECAAAWHHRLMALLPAVELMLTIGQYAIAWHLGDARKASLTETVAAFRDYLPGCLPLPHPSWRTGGWERRNTWFAADVLPELRRRVRAVIEQ
ncbi:MAG: uracil-DNA glycosylase family protein [Alphaproteobacteria bacterium]|nr:uracil-DNA glycosylase family protein [Alphaproteobacteria bacterium]